MPRPSRPSISELKFPEIVPSALSEISWFKQIPTMPVSVQPSSSSISEKLSSMIWQFIADISDNCQVPTKGCISFSEQARRDTQADKSNKYEYFIVAFKFDVKSSSSLFYA